MRSIEEIERDIEIAQQESDTASENEYQAIERTVKATRKLDDLNEELEKAIRKETAR